MRGPVALCRFEVRRIVRNTHFVLVGVVLPVGLYLAFAPGTPAHGHVEHVGPRVFLLANFATFAAIGAGFSAGGPQVSMERTSGWYRQLRLTPLSAPAYLMVKLVRAVVLLVPALA